MQLAASHGNLEFVKFLVEKGADINLKGVNGETALFNGIYKYAQ